MLTYSFQDMEGDSLYEYLYRRIREDILEGRIRAGEKLPSKRSFAKNLGVSTVTVESAYAQLAAEGYIRSVPRSGYYVSKIDQTLLTPARPVHSGEERQSKSEAEFGGRTEKWSERWGERENQGPGAGEIAPRTGDGGAKRGDEIDLVSGSMDPAQFPFTIWAKLMREVLSGRREELMTRAPGGGVPELRQAIADYLLQYQGIRVKREQVIIGAGTEYLYGLLIQLLGQDKVYALEDPGYEKVTRVYRSHLVKTAYIPMDGEGVRVDRLRESCADIMHISPSHHFPTGVTTPIGRRYELLGWAGEAPGRYIIEDDYDCEFRLAGRPIPSLQSIDRQGRVIYMNTFTKSLTPTIRISYMVLPPGLLDDFAGKLGFYSCTVSNFEQYTLAEFIRKGYFEKHINRMRNYYRGKRDELLRAVGESPLGELAAIRGADAGLHFLMEVKTGLEDEELIRRAAGQGVRISCLSQYSHGTASGGEVRGSLIVNYSGLAAGQEREAVRRLYLACYGAGAAGAE